MIEITTQEIENLKNIGAGKFGRVFQKNDQIAYKIYHNHIYDDFGRKRENPTLKLSQKRYDSLKRRSRNLVHTGGIYDVIIINGKFGGVCIPYYEGSVLSELMDAPLSSKIEISNQLVRNSKELNRHLIYPTDYKLNNVMYSNDMVQIIDIDDRHTHICRIPNLIYYYLGLDALGETIQTFFQEHQIYPILDKDIIKKLSRNRGGKKKSYQQIESYIESKQEDVDILFIDEETDISEVQKRLRQKPYKIVYLVQEYTAPRKVYLEIIEKLEEKQIPLFDILLEEKIRQYPKTIQIQTIEQLRGKQLIKRFDKSKENN